MLQRMLEARGDAPWPSRLRCVLLGGSAAPPRLIEEGVRRGLPIAPTYGLTEATSQVTTLLPDETSRKPASSGVPLPLTEVRIVAQAGVAPPGEVGEIEIRGPTVFAGYIGDHAPGSSDPTDGWFRTGDAGYLDSDGYLYVVDRRDDLIVSGGENVYPAEIERVLRQHPSVVDAGVIGVADESWGSRPLAAVVWRGDLDRASVELLDHCRQHLPGYKIPDRVLFLSELPRSPSGKLLRRTLRETIAESPQGTASEIGDGGPESCHPEERSISSDSARTVRTRRDSAISLALRMTLTFGATHKPDQSWAAMRSVATADRLSSRIRTISSTWSRLTISGGAYSRWSPATPSAVPAPGYDTRPRASVASPNRFETRQAGGNGAFVARSRTSSTPSRSPKPAHVADDLVPLGELAQPRP